MEGEKCLLSRSFSRQTGKQIDIPDRRTDTINSFRTHLEIHLLSLFFVSFINESFEMREWIEHERMKLVGVGTLRGFKVNGNYSNSNSNNKANIFPRWEQWTSGNYREAKERVHNLNAFQFILESFSKHHLESEHKKREKKMFVSNTNLLEDLLFDWWVIGLGFGPKWINRPHSTRPHFRSHSTFHFVTTKFLP